MIERLDPGETAGPFTITIPREGVSLVREIAAAPRWRRALWRRLRIGYRRRTYAVGGFPAPLRLRDVLRGPDW